jgi:hypothetical protein
MAQRTGRAMPTFAERAALQAVKDGEVTLDYNGCRTYPAGVNGSALTSAHRKEWWRWPERPGANARAVLTSDGNRVLG